MLHFCEMKVVNEENQIKWGVSIKLGWQFNPQFNPHWSKHFVADFFVFNSLAILPSLLKAGVVVGLTVFDGQ